MTSRTKSNKAKMEKGLKPWLKKVPFATWFENCCFPAGRQHKHRRRHGSYLALSCRSSRPQTSKGHGNFCRNFIDCNPPKEPKGQKDTRISMIFAGCPSFKWSVCVHLWSFWCHAVGASQTAGLGRPCHCSEFAARHPRPGELQLRAAAESCFNLPEASIRGLTADVRGQLWHQHRVSLKKLSEMTHRSHPHSLQISRKMRPKRLVSVSQNSHCFAHVAAVQGRNLREFQEPKSQAAKWAEQQSWFGR